jgi:sulfate permease, SulP family
VLTGGSSRKGAPVLDLGVALVVSILSITVNIVLAVFLGLALAVSLFVLRMSRSNVRRQYRCGSVRSRRSLDAENMAILESTGSSILVIELQGALFFGSADRLAQEIDTATAEATRWLILDLRRVTDIDSTSMRILVDIETDLARRSIELAVVLHARSATGQRLAELSSRRFPDIDLAIEWAEDNLLDSRTATGRSTAELSLEQIPLLRQFTLEQIARFIPRGRSREPSLLGDTWARQRATDIERPQHQARNVWPRKPVRRIGSPRPGTALGDCYGR